MPIEDLALRAKLHVAMGRLRRLMEHLPPNSDLSVAITSLDELVRETVNTAIFPTGEEVKHLKRGTEYRILGTGNLNSADEYFVRYILPDCSGELSKEEKRKIAFDRQDITIYADKETGRLSARPTAEFRDGRFVTTKS